MATPPLNGYNLRCINLVEIMRLLILSTSALGLFLNPTLSAQARHYTEICTVGFGQTLQEAKDNYGKTKGSFEWSIHHSGLNTVRFKFLYFNWLLLQEATDLDLYKWISANGVLYALLDPTHRIIHLKSTSTNQVINVFKYGACISESPPKNNLLRSGP